MERTITYEAPFDRCDRVEDYRVAWAFFEKEAIGAGPSTKTPTKGQSYSSNGRLWQHPIHFELLPLEMMHLVVI